jgi:hypothetical protein
VRKDGGVPEISVCGVHSTWAWSSSIVSWWRGNLTSHFSFWGLIEELEASGKDHIHKTLLLQSIWHLSANEAVCPQRGPCPFLDV